MRSQERQLANTANDVANVSTPGYKPLAAASLQGAVAPTGGSLDLAILGNGYLRIARPDGSTGFTRNGALATDAQGRLVSGDGGLLDPAITVPAGAQGLRVSPGGDVSAAVGGKLVPLGRIELSGFRNPDGLAPAGDGTLDATAASGPPQAVSTPIAQGYLETSDSDLADSAVSQIVVSSTYSALGSVVRTADSMQQTLLEMFA
jgi:flagellar basal-body rod protein FlgG